MKIATQLWTFFFHEEARKNNSLFLGNVYSIIKMTTNYSRSDKTLKEGTPRLSGNPGSASIHCGKSKDEATVKHDFLFKMNLLSILNAVNGERK